MMSDTIETYAQEHFDYDAYIAVFLHTSAVYLGICEGSAMTRPLGAWQPKPAVVTQEAQYA